MSKHGGIAIAAIAASIRLLWVRDAPSAPPLRVTLTTAAAFIAAIAAIIIQLMTVFGRPENISQTFDAIVHLNTIRYAMDTANASAFHIGATSDIAFYPNAWHALVTLSGLVSGSSVPVAVNAANIAIGAVAWPASVIALSLTTLGNRMAVGIAAAALSTGFGAFPIASTECPHCGPISSIQGSGVSPEWLSSSTGRRRVIWIPIRFTRAW